MGDKKHVYIKTKCSNRNEREIKTDMGNKYLYDIQ